MSGSDETFIVRVRRHEGDAVIEQPRLSRRLRIREVSEVGALILRWLEPDSPSPEKPPSGVVHPEGGLRCDLP
jgi:hypothetical protein